MIPLSSNIICLVGPTASGKSDLAQKIALELDAEIVSADSMQIYRGMDIGTGKVTRDQQLVRHHCLDIVEPGTPYSAALYQEDARAALQDINARGKRILLVGGTGLYVRAAIDDYAFPKGDNADNPVRDHYMFYAQEHGAQALWDLLDQRDPESAREIHPNNVRRVVRAFELLAEGESYARQKERLQDIPQLYPAVFIGLKVAPDVLRERINQRVDGMVEAGLVREVEALLSQGFRDGLTASQAIGYKEIVSALDGACSLSDAIDDIKIASRRYGKRQRTWFGRDTRVNWVNAEEGIERMIEECLEIVDRADRHYAQVNFGEV